MDRNQRFALSCGLLERTADILDDGRNGCYAAHVIRPLRLGAVSSGVVDAIASAITTQEGYYPGSLAWRNNNPGNLVYAGQAGAVRGEGGFAKFASAADGAQALRDQINLDLSRGTDVNGNPTTTIAQLVSSWAPPSENDTAAYIANVAAATGLDPNAPLDSDSAGSFSVSSPFSASVDLSSIGLPSSVPVVLVAGISLLALLLGSRR